MASLIEIGLHGFICMFYNFDRVILICTFCLRWQTSEKTTAIIPALSDTWIKQGAALIGKVTIFYLIMKLTSDQITCRK